MINGDPKMRKTKPWCDQIKMKRKVVMSRTRLRAHWIDVSDATTDNGGYDWHIRDYKCDNCGIVLRMYDTTNFCSHCGARMVKKNGRK